MSDNNLYMDPNTGKLFFGEKLEAIQDKMNDILGKELEKKGVLSYHEFCDMLAESIKDEDERKMFLEGLLTPWSNDVGFIDLKLELENPPLWIEQDLP